MMMQGLQLMALGMGTVFAFLGLLVLTMHSSAAYFRHFGDTFPECVFVLQKPFRNTPK